MRQSVKDDIEIARPSGADQNPGKLQAIIAEATEVFNQHGVSGARISEIAERAGLNRVSMYHYIGSREQLVYQTYTRTCEAVLGHYQAAETAGGSGFAMLANAIQRYLAPEAPPLVMLTEIASLSPLHRAKIEDLQDRCRALLARFIEHGMADGSISPHYNPLLASVLIEGALGWLPMWRLPGRVEVQALDAEDFIDFLLHGRAPVDRPFQTEFKRPRLRLHQDRNPAFDREKQQTQKIDALIQVATDLFNSYGSEGTSLDVVVKRLGVTKGAFYHYFQDKNDLLFRCQERSLRLINAILDLADEEGETGLEKLQLNSSHGFDVRYGPLGPIALFAGFRALPSSRRDTLMEAANANYRRLREFTREGMRDGSIRRDVGPAALFATAGATNWLPLVPRVLSAFDLEEIQQNLLMLFTNGLTPRPIDR